MKNVQQIVTVCVQVILVLCAGYLFELKSYIASEGAILFSLIMAPGCLPYYVYSKRAQIYYEDTVTKYTTIIAGIFIIITLLGNIVILYKLFGEGIRSLFLAMVINCIVHIGLLFVGLILSTYEHRKSMEYPE